MILADILDRVLAARNAIITGVVVAGLSFPLGYCEGQRSANAKNDAERAAANVVATTTARNADEAAAVERVDAALTIAKQEEHLTDAIASTPDTAPDAVRVALGCERLRISGTPDADLPAVCGRSSAGGAEAQAQP